MRNNDTEMNATDGTACLLARIRACKVCAAAEHPLPVTPNPIIQASSGSRIRIIGQAPGIRAHDISLPFNDPSGDRLRNWLGVDRATFYDPDSFAITPMGFCFPGYDKHGSDLPPRKECGPLWQSDLDAALPNVKLTLVIGMYAVKWHLGKRAHRNLTETVRHWQDYGPALMPLPHPSWRNNAWIKRHDWFSEELDVLKMRVSDILSR